MPTGYTSSIYDNKNVSFEDFVLCCARAFGVCIHQRDNDINEKPKLRELDIQYHLDALKEEKYKKPTKAEFEAYKKEKIEEAYASLKKDKEVRERYTLMLEKVRKWNPPTPDHAGLKKFMIEQLENSIKFDCHEDYRLLDVNTWKRMKYSDYVSQLKFNSERSIKYHTEEIEKEKKNVDATNKWLTDLYNGLNINVK